MTDLSPLNSIAEFDRFLISRESGNPVQAARVRTVIDILREAGVTEWLITDASSAKPSPRGTYRLREALSTSEFPVYFGDVLQREVLARFTMWAKPWERYTKTGTFNDLTRKKRATQFRGGSETLQQVGENGPYPSASTSPVHFEWKGYKYGKDFPVTWETWLADDLDGLRDLPNVLATSAQAAEQELATSFYVDANGPHASLYTIQNGNVGTLPLSVTSLEDGFTAMAGFRDPVTGHPILNRPRYLVVTPEDEINARRIVESSTVTFAGATSGMPFATNNIISTVGLEVIVDPWIRVIGSNIAAADRPWFLFSDPNSGPLGPGLAFAQLDRLRGMNGPLLLQQAGQFRALGGGDDPRGPMNDMDATNIRVIHALGGRQLFFQATYASSGTAPGSG